MRWTPILSIAVLLAGVPVLPAHAAPPVQAEPAGAPAPEGCGRPHPMGLNASFPGEFPGGPPHGPVGPAGFETPVPPYLRALTLSDDQQDRIFDLLHAQAPHARQLVRSLHKARAQLIELGLSDKYDEAAARALVDASTTAEAELSLLRARTDHAIIAVLTPEQRRQVASDSPGRGHHSPGGPEGCWH